MVELSGSFPLFWLPYFLSMAIGVGERARGRACNSICV